MKHEVIGELTQVMGYTYAPPQATVHMCHIRTCGVCVWLCIVSYYARSLVCYSRNKIVTRRGPSMSNILSSSKVGLYSPLLLLGP